MSMRSRQHNTPVKRGSGIEASELLNGICISIGGLQATRDRARLFKAKSLALQEYYARFMLKALKGAVNSGEDGWGNMIGYPVTDMSLRIVGQRLRNAAL